MTGLPNKILYSPALRMKTGELSALRELATDVAEAILPRLIVPPPNERDEEQQSMLFASDNTPDIGGVLVKYWINRPVLIDATFLLEECGRTQISTWLPMMFSRARAYNVNAIPMAMLQDIGEIEIHGFKAAISNSDSLKFAICISSGDMVGTELGENLKKALSDLGLKASDCAVIADFSDADFSTPEHVAPIIDSSLELLQELGAWKHIIFQATHYPTTNPATPESTYFWPRNEWLAWCQAVKFNPETAEHMLFGDFAADCAKMNFGGKGGGRAIRHYRYTTERAWFIVRGAKTGTDSQIMQTICKKIVESEYFAKPEFSSGDLYIYDTANQLEGPGSATIWRKVNTNHHVTRVVNDVAKVRGIAIAKTRAELTTDQRFLFSELEKSGKEE